jgi:hypothetical protein
MQGLMIVMAAYRWRKTEDGYLKRPSEVQEGAAEACYRSWRGWEEQSLEEAAAWHEQVRRCQGPSC